MFVNVPTSLRSTSPKSPSATPRLVRRVRVVERDQDVEQVNADAHNSEQTQPSMHVLDVVHGH